MIERFLIIFEKPQIRKLEQARTRQLEKNKEWERERDGGVQMTAGQSFWRAIQGHLQSTNYFRLRLRKAKPYKFKIFSNPEFVYVIFEKKVFFLRTRVLSQQ